jgi:uncharacterized zinc-type alcohol dehydrogenase-like protein
VPYPLTVGHEIVGHVTEVGAEVTRHAVGERVGVGCMVNSCRECENCRAGQEQYCLPGNVGTYASVDRDGTVTQGGYSTHIVVDEDFVLRVPDAIPHEAVAPLLCAGITTYSPLAHWNAGPGTKVAVVSQTLAKKDDGLAFGAEHYHATSDPATFEALANTFDLIINTVSAPIDINAYLGLLRLDGTLVNVGAPPEPMPVQVFKLFDNRRSFAGSGIGGIAETQQMLEFCAERGIAPEVEVITADAVNDAYERVLSSDVRYRFVIDIDSLR